MTAKRRILIAETTPMLPAALTLSIWNPSDKNAAVSLSGSNLIATTSRTDGTFTCVRGNVPMLYGQWYWETTHTFTGTGEVIAGLSASDASLLNAPGDNPPIGNIAGPNKLGQCWRSRSLRKKWATTAAITSGSIIRHWFDADAKIYSVAVNGGSWFKAGQVPQAGEGPLMYPIVGLFRANGTDTASCAANFGTPVGSTFAYAVPEGANSGVYTQAPPSPIPLYFSSEGFNTSAAETPSSLSYLARIAGDQDVEVESEMSCWVWGGQTVSRPGQLVLINNDNGISLMKELEWRNAPISLYQGFEGDARADFVLWSTSRVDRIDLTDQRRIVLILTDPLSRLDNAIQKDLYPDGQANSQIAGKPLPIVIGSPLFCEGLLLDTTPAVRNYQINDNDHSVGSPVDAVLDSITSIYDRGDIFAGPDDPYSATTPITAANGGDFGSWSGSPPVPANWTRLTPFGATNDKFTSAAGGGLRCQSGFSAITAIYHNASALAANSRYTIAFNVSAATVGGTLYFRAGSVTVSRDIATGVTTPHSFTIDTAEAAQLQIVLQGGACDVSIRNLRVSSAQIIDWTYWLDSASARAGFHLAYTPAGKVVCNPVIKKVSDSLPIQTLSDVIDYIVQLSIKAGMDPPTFEGIAKAQDNANYIVSRYVNSPVTALSLIRELMDGWCGSVNATKFGTLNVRRITPPSSESLLTLDSTNITNEISIHLDEAKGLSLRLAGRRNNSVHSASDVIPSASPALRQLLTTEWTYRTGAPTITSGVVADAYSAAVGAEAKTTWLQSTDDIQAEINRVATIWRVKRWFYQVEVDIDGTLADSLTPGTTVKLVWPMYGLEGGKNLLVVGVRSRFFSRKIDLKLWG